MFAVWTKGATLNHYPCNIRHRFIGEMGRRVGGAWGTRRSQQWLVRWMLSSISSNLLSLRSSSFFSSSSLFSSSKILSVSLSPSPSLCSLQFFMFYNLVCFGWIRWNFNLDSKFGYVLHDLGFIFLGMLFMFKICVNGEWDKYHFLILFLLHFCSIFCFGRRET